MTVTWNSPSNIALIKYWGKYGQQLPRNASLSMTLHEASTTTTVNTEKKRQKKPTCTLYFENKRHEAFENKVLHYLQTVQKSFPFIGTHHLEIHTENSFPHSAGIASSASAMSALALCLCSLDMLHGGKSPDNFFRKASHFARIGSGSAARSVFGEWSVWGKSPLVEGSSNLHAVPYPITYHNNFTDIQDTILLVSSEEKQVSSRAGHALMEHHPMASQRYKNARRRLEELLAILQSGDWMAFSDIVEAEALELHALMMTSNPSYMLLLPDTVAIIQRIREFRIKTGLPVCFTLDAGPNVHILYPYFEKKKVRNFIQKELYPFCGQKAIYDYMGRGPKQNFV